MPTGPLPAAHEMRLHFDAMASRNEIVVAGMAQAQARAAAQSAADEVRRIEAKYSRYRPDSVVSRINASAGAGAVAVDAETAGLLDFSARLFEASGGLFDVTSGPLRRAWDFRAGRVPTEAQLAPLRALVGWDGVEWDGHLLRLPRAGMELDFGGIGKEYAADRAQAVLLQAGARHGFVNLAGDLRLLGPDADGAPWTFAVQHPRDADAACAQVRLSHGALATSGDYERFFVTPEGRRCCHILDPRTGQPVAHWQSISVIAPSCAAAGALATIGMLLGQEALPFLHAQGAAFLAVDPLGRVHPHDIDSPLPDPRPLP
jgi:thiamine biosynthesis lipoprotein